MKDVLVAIGHHRTSSIPTTVSDDVNLGSQEGIGGSNNRPDVQIVLPVLNGNVEFVTLCVKV
jgi:hypothetical protein